MPDDNEIPEYYSDMFEVVGGAFGATLNFMVSPPVPRAETRETAVRIRMSWEHIKAMTFILQRHIKQVEQDQGISYPISNKTLVGMNIPPEDWNEFWKYIKGI
jgi:hypothetical protein